MRKASTPLLIVVVLALPHFSLLSGCGDPLFGKVAVIEQSGESEAGAADAEHDAGRAGSDATLASSSDCVVLFEQNAASAADAGDPITVQTASALGCHAPDAGMSFVPDNIFRRRDGALLVEANQLYSFRWMIPLLLPRVRIYGGNDGCPSVPLIDRTIGLVAVPPAVLATCQEFTPQIDAKQLLLYGEDYQIAIQTLFGTDPLALTVCRGGCPPNTQPIVDDAGVADAGGFQVPPIPALPSTP